MNYYKMVVYTEGRDFETKEYLLDLETFRKVQKAIAEDKEFLIFSDKVIKRTMVKEILPADDIVNEYQKVGIPLKELGLPEHKKIDEPVRKFIGMQSISKDEK